MTVQLPHFYESRIEWTGEKMGHLSVPGLPALQVATPPEFDGHDGFWSPEHYFVAAVNSCIMTTFLAIAEGSKLQFESYQAQATGKLEKPENEGYRITEIIIRPRLVISQSKDMERAGRILQKAEKHCLISNSIKAVVHLEPQILIASGSDSSEPGISSPPGKGPNRRVT